MMRAIVVEDERLTMERICSLLRETGRVEVIGGYTNPLEALEEIFKLKPEAVFLDIEMPELDGLQLAEKIYETELQSEIVFITAYNEYALDAFKVNALDYLLKPVIAKELDRAVDRVEKRRPSQVPSGDRSPKIRVAVLGGFNIWTDESKNSEPLRWYTAKCKELMAYFVLKGALTEVSKWKLIELLWPDRDSEKGDINLRSTLCRLNKTLKESQTGLRIISNRNSYLLRADNMTVDALELQKLALDGKSIDKSNLAGYEAAFSSYKGSLLEGYEFSWCEEWMVSSQRNFVLLCRRLIEYYLEQMKDATSALNIVEAWLKCEPYDEEAHYLALKLHNITRGRAAANSYFQSLCSILETDLGIKPGGAVRELYNKIIDIK